MKQMTQEQYKKQPYLCPYCQSTNIEALEWDSEASEQKVKCSDCGKQWWDTYVLTGYEEIKES